MRSQAKTSHIWKFCTQLWNRIRLRRNEKWWKMAKKRIIYKFKVGRCIITPYKQPHILFFPHIAVPFWSFSGKCLREHKFYFHVDFVFVSILKMNDTFSPHNAFFLELKFCVWISTTHLQISLFCLLVQLIHATGFHCDGRRTEMKTSHTVTPTQRKSGNPLAKFTGT